MSNPDLNTPISDQLRRQHDDEKERITNSCFSRVDETGNLPESYITHVKVIEDSHYPSSRPPMTSPDKNKKFRVIIVAVRLSGRVRLHKARENPNGTFQIGKTWNMEDLTRIEGDVTDPCAIIMHIGKPYYWRTRTREERNLFINSAIKVYKRYTGGRVPELVNIESKGGSGPSTAVPSRKGTASPQPKTPPPARTPPVTQSDQPKEPKEQKGSKEPKEQKESKDPKEQKEGKQHRHHYHIPHGLHIKHHNKQSGNNGEKGNNDRATSRENLPPGLQAPYKPAITTEPKDFPFPVSQDEPQEKAYSKHQKRPSLPLNATESFSPVATRPRGLSTAASQPSVPTTRPRGLSTTASQPTVPTRYHNHSRSNSRQDLLQPAQDQPEKPSQFPLQPPQQVQQTTQQMSQMQEPQMPVQPPQRVETPTIVVDESPDDSMHENSSDPSNQMSYESTPLHMQSSAVPSAELTQALKRSSISDVKIFAHTHENDTQAISDIAAVATAIHATDPTTGQTEEEASRQQLRFNVAENANEGRPKKSGHQRNISVSSITSRDSQAKRAFSFSAPSDASAVEETLSEFNWSGRNDSRSLEVSIGNELSAIEASTTHNVVDLDDRLDDIDHILTAAVDECNNLDAMLAFFSVQLSSFADDVRHIEGQGKGIQVQTNHQKDLWNELHRILQAVSLPDEVFETIRTNRFEVPKELSHLEGALSELYKALILSGAGGSMYRSSNLYGRDSLAQMRAMQEKRQWFEQVRDEFGDRFKEFVEGKFKQALANTEGIVTTQVASEEPQLVRPEIPFVKLIYPYSGIVLFLREVDQYTYDSVLRTYEYAAKPYYENAIISYAAKWRRIISQLAGKNDKFSFAGKQKDASSGSDGITKSLKRSGTLAKFKSSESREARLSATQQRGDPPKVEKTWTINMTAHSQIKKSLGIIVDNLVSAVIAQQEFLVQEFHQSSFGAKNFPNFVKKYPIPKRQASEEAIATLRVREIESDVEMGRQLTGILANIFSNLQGELVKFAEFIAKESVLELPTYLILVEKNIKRLEETNQDYLGLILKRVLDRASHIWMAFIDRQIKAISNTIVSSKKRKGAVYFVKVLPTFCKTIEDDFRDLGLRDMSSSDYHTRQLIDDSYDKIFREIFQSLHRLEKEQAAEVSYGGATEDYEDKELLNYHIMMIENMSVIKDGIATETNGMLMSHRGSAMMQYNNEVRSYIHMILGRPMGRIIEFIEGVEAAIARNPRENPASRNTFSKSAVKRALSGIDGKELKKRADALYSRVEKHFLGEEGDQHVDKNPQLMAKVWAALQQYAMEVHTRLVAILQKYYTSPDNPNSGVGMIEFTASDITNAFSRAK
ncbi:exocyst complex component Sec3p [Trichomonascus vanleenenianus]|uniref:GTP-Rho binding exocyst subunit SEC3 n=1 Tax=Trichomonascus vanleenenianus TaxID=2268995 RepID=UPI003ECA97FB